MYTTTDCSKEQAQKIFDKHCKKNFLGISKIVSLSYSYDNEDNIGFVTLKTRTGKKISYQLRNDDPCFVEFTGFGDIRYDIPYPHKLNFDLYNFLKDYSKKAKANFWKGGQI